MDFTFTEDQVAIRDLAHQIFADRSTDEFMLAFDRGDKTYDDELWSVLAQQGLLAMAIPEHCGGTGLGLVELCFMLEEQGRSVSPIPLYASLVLGALPIAEFGNPQQQEKYLTPLTQGLLKLTAAIGELGIPSATAGQVQAVELNGMWTLNGSLDCIPDGPCADAIIVPAWTDGKQTLFIVDAHSDGLIMTAQTTSLGDNQGSLVLQDLALDSSAILGKAAGGDKILRWLEMRAEVGICALQLGVTEEALKRTAEFTCERQQFGVPIGSFQAVAMQAADAFIDVEAIRSTYWLALYKLTNGGAATAEVRCAKWYAADAGHRIVYRTQHLHGGMGADIDYPIHRFFLWAKHLGLMLGGSSIQLAKLGALLASDETVGLAALEV
ncbi:MAG: alkylation response protein AidB-like acyl-CoA dehydrogenase [Halioglobus sp.]|jgi:alkylation response protein AidB-like acyl-CoA dehydrogenase